MNMPNRENGPQIDFEQRKHDFFVKIGLKAREWLKTHRDLGKLWEGRKKDRWENVSEHCLVEAARVEVLADLLKLSPETKEDLFVAAIIHDFNKKEEILETAKQGRSVESFDIIYAQTRDKLKSANVPSRIAEMADCVGHATVKQIEEIMEKSALTDQDIAMLVMHYVDDYTLGSEWVQPAVFDSSGKIAKNDFDRRMDANENNPKYQKIAEAGFYVEQRRVGLLVEAKLAELIKNRSGEDINQKILPEYIDLIIQQTITHEKK